MTIHTEAARATRDAEAFAYVAWNAYCDPADARAAASAADAAWTAYRDAAEAVESAWTDYRRAFRAVDAASRDAAVDTAWTAYLAARDIAASARAAAFCVS